MSRTPAGGGRRDLSGGHLAQRTRRYEKIRVVAQDGFLKLAQCRRGLHAQLLDKARRPSRKTRRASSCRPDRYRASINCPRTRSLSGFACTSGASSAEQRVVPVLARSRSRRRSSAPPHASSRAISAPAKGSSTKSSSAPPRHRPRASRSSATCWSGGADCAARSRSSNRAESSSSRPTSSRYPVWVVTSAPPGRDLAKLGDVGLDHFPGADRRVLPQVLDQAPSRHRRPVVQLQDR